MTSEHRTPTRARQACVKPLLAQPVCAGYSIADLRFTSAFDVHADKIDRDPSEAIWMAPNNALKFADVPHLNLRVRPGVLGDGVGPSCAPYIPVKDDGHVGAIASHLVETRTHVLVNFLPAGSQRATEIYADATLQAGSAFINCMPATLARSDQWTRKSGAARVPLLGDDLKSQMEDGNIYISSCAASRRPPSERGGRSSCAW